LITHAPTREESIDLMREALDSYLIRGVQHNVAFCRALCIHPKFRAGDLSTDFIRDEYPDGFEAPALSDNHQKQLISAAFFMNQMIASNGRFDTPPSGAVEMVCGIGAQGSQILSMTKETVSCKHDLGQHPTFTFSDSETTIDLHDVSWPGAHEPLFRATIQTQTPGTEPTSESVIVQFVERLNQGLRLQIGGTTYDVAIISALEHKLSSFLIPKEAVDMSKSLISPMPGSLVSVAVEPGQEVEIGQELAVVEAMKMQNILRAETKGVVKGVVAGVGENLQVDQLILEFE